MTGWSLITNLQCWQQFQPLHLVPAAVVRQGSNLQKPTPSLWPWTLQHSAPNRGRMKNTPLLRGARLLPPGLTGMFCGDPLKVQCRHFLFCLWLCCGLVHTCVWVCVCISVVRLQVIFWKALLVFCLFFSFFLTCFDMIIMMCSLLLLMFFFFLASI